MEFLHVGEDRVRCAITVRWKFDDQLELEGVTKAGHVKPVEIAGC